MAPRRDRWGEPIEDDELEGDAHDDQPVPMPQWLRVQIEAQRNRQENR